MKKKLLVISASPRKGGNSDLLSLNQACVDLVYAAPDGKDLIQRVESRHGIHALEFAETIGLGSRTYELIHID